MKAVTRAAEEPRPVLWAEERGTLKVGNLEDGVDRVPGLE